MAANVRRVFVCIAVMLLVSDCGANSDEDAKGTTAAAPQTTDPGAATTTIKATTDKATTQAATTNKATTQAATTNKATTQAMTTETGTMGTQTGTATMTTSFLSTAGTEMETTTANLPTSAEPPPAGEWTIKVDGDKVCMKLQFGGTFSIGEDTVDIPLKGITDASTCSDDLSVFNLVNSLDDPTFNMTMQFQRLKDKPTYELNRIYYTILDVSSIQPTLYYGDRSKQYFEAPMGKYYTCASAQKEQFHGNVILTLTKQKYQPFAQKSGGDYGNAFTCGDNLPDDHGPRVGLIVSMTLLALLVVAGCGFFVYRRRKSSYQRFNNGI